MVKLIKENINYLSFLLSQVLIHELLEEIPFPLVTIENFYFQFLWQLGMNIS